jgi:hypothetical protein
LFVSHESSPVRWAVAPRPDEFAFNSIDERLFRCYDELEQTFRSGILEGGWAMATTTFQLNNDIFSGFRRFKQRVTARGLWFGLILLAALAAFELFNFATTEFALQSLFGAHDALGITTWAKVLAIAFCGIDFAGIARLFTPEQGADEPHEVWYLFGAWMLAATMNAMLTWWGVSIALLNHQSLGNAVVERATLLKVVPIFVAVMVWLIRVLIIGTISVAGDRLFSQADLRITRNRMSAKPKAAQSAARPQPKPFGTRRNPVRRGVSAAPTTAYRPAPKPEPSSESDYTPNEPTYHPVSFSGNQNRQRNHTRF